MGGQHDLVEPEFADPEFLAWWQAEWVKTFENASAALIPSPLAKAEELGRERPACGVADASRPSESKP